MAPLDQQERTLELSKQQVQLSHKKLASESGSKILIGPRKIESHHVHLGDQVRDHGASFLGTLRFIVFAIIPSLLCLLTAHNTTGSRKIGVAKVEKHREVSRLIPGSKAKRSIVKFVAAM